MGGVLDGTRVLDFGRYIAGPFCAGLLGDLGADVVRVERRGGGEDRWVLPVAAGGDGAIFLQVNRNKRGMTLDPSTSGGKGVLRRLVAVSDVVVANLPPRALAELGLDYASVRALRPDAILVSVSAFGPGPYQDRVGFDGIGQAMSGAMHLAGHGDGPMKAYVPYVDFTTAILSAFGALAAILHRRQTGRGQHVEGSLLASALTISNATLIEQALLERDRIASGNRSQLAGPSDAFRTRDGWILVQCVGDPLFRRWTALLGEPHWETDPRFATDILRGENGAALSARMAEWCEKRSSAEALAELERARIPAGPIYSPRETLADPHVQASGLLAGIAFPGLASDAPIMRTPVTLSDSPAEIRSRAPVLGEHTDEILGELGYAAAEIQQLRAAGAI